MRAQDLFKEYIWLVNTIRRAGRISLEDINAAWRRSALGSGQDFVRSTFNRHKEAIEEIFGIRIDCDRSDGYKYYIYNVEDLDGDSVQQWVLSTLGVNQLLSQNAALHDRILLESIPSDGEALQEVLDAMHKGVKVRIFYQKYGAPEPAWRVIAPYCVKLHRRRWYVLSAVDSGELRTFSLDRVKRIEPTEETFVLPPDFEAGDFFRDRVGIMREALGPKQRVVIRSYGFDRFFLRDLPLHASQQEVAQGADYADFEYHLVPTVDLVNQVMALGDRRQILEPAWLAQEIAQAHRSGAARYGE